MATSYMTKLVAAPGAVVNARSAKCVVVMVVCIIALLRTVTIRLYLSASKKKLMNLSPFQTVCVVSITNADIIMIINKYALIIPLQRNRLAARKFCSF